MSGKSLKDGTYPFQSSWSLNIVHIVPHLDVKLVVHSLNIGRLDEIYLPPQYSCLARNSLLEAAINSSDLGQICNGFFGAAGLNYFRSPLVLFLVGEWASLVNM